MENVRKIFAKYTLVAGKLYKIWKGTPIFICLGMNETTLLLIEVHKGVCGIDLRRKLLTNMLLRIEYY